MKLQEQIKQLQEQRIQEIINNESISKLDRLNLIKQERLFNIAPYIQDEFKEWGEEFKEQLKLENPSSFCMIDSFYDPSTFDFEKYETIYYDEIEDILDNLVVDDDDGFTGDNYIVFTNRQSKTVFRKSKQEIIDKIYDFCIANKYIGFKMDW
jgi:hypothetical protein